MVALVFFLRTEQFDGSLMWHLDHNSHVDWYLVTFQKLKILGSFPKLPGLDT